MPANLAAVEGGEPVPTLEHFQNYLSHMAANRAQEKGGMDVGSLPH